VPGDDPRRLDWRAAARSQRLVVRQTESEEELDLLLLLDGSGGMAYGEGEAHKWTRAASLSAALASVALRQGDRVGLVLGAGAEVDTSLLAPVARRARLRNLAAHLVAHTPRGDCPWPELLARVAPTLGSRRRSLVVVVSDFLDPGGPSSGSGSGSGSGEDEGRAADAALLGGLGLLRAGGHDVVLLQVLHRDELTFPWDRARVLELEDARGRRAPVEGPGSSLRSDYLERLGAHLSWLEARCEREGLALVRAVSDLEAPTQILDLLAQLAGERRGNMGMGAGEGGP